MRGKPIALIIMTLVIVIGFSSPAQTQLRTPPANVIVSTIIKLAGFEKKLSGSPAALVAYVIGDPEVGEEFEAALNTKIGKAKLKKVVIGEMMPSANPNMPYIPDILYIGDPLMVDEATKYARMNKILSVTGHPILAPKGVTLSIGLGKDDKPVILLNQPASVAEDHSWNPAIMKIAKIVKESN